MYVTNVNARNVAMRSKHEQQQWDMVAKLYPYSWSTKELGFALFLGSMLGITIGMIFGIGFCMR